jgi:hypothetical protein
MFATLSLAQQPTTFLYLCIQHSFLELSAANYVLKILSFSHSRKIEIFVSLRKTDDFQ